MDDALTAILLTSDGATGKWSTLPRAKATRQGTQTPTSGLATDVHELDIKFTRCTTHRQRLELIKEAQDTWRNLTHSPSATEWQQAIANDTRPYAELVKEYGVSDSTIKRIKRAAGTNGQHGGSRPGAGRKSRVTD